LKEQENALKETQEAFEKAEKGLEAAQEKTEKRRGEVEEAYKAALLQMGFTEKDLENAEKGFLEETPEDMEFVRHLEFMRSEAQPTFFQHGSAAGSKAGKKGNGKTTKREAFRRLSNNDTSFQDKMLQMH